MTEPGLKPIKVALDIVTDEPRDNDGLQTNKSREGNTEDKNEELDIQIARKIESLSHPLSSELLNQLDQENNGDHKPSYLEQDNDTFKANIGISRDTTPIKRKQRLSMSGNDDLGNSGTLLRKRSNSRTSSGTRTVRNSSSISPASKIFRNLLILEDDLRRQAREQKRLRWQYITFYSTLMGIAGFVVYELYFTTDLIIPPPDNYYHWPRTTRHKTSSNTSLYRFVLQMTLVFVIITVFLFYISGQYRRTIILPRRFFNSTNKGIKQFNLRLIKVHSSWDEKFTDLVRFISESVAMIQLWILHEIFRFKDNAVIRFWENVKIRAQPRIGATDVKLVLNPKHFSAEVREGWEIYRDEFWAREGARRRKQQPGGDKHKQS